MSPLAHRPPRQRPVLRRGASARRPSAPPPCRARDLSPDQALTAEREAAAIAAWWQLTPATQRRLMGHPGLSEAGMARLASLWERHYQQQRRRQLRRARASGQEPRGDGTLRGPLLDTPLGARLVALPAAAVARWGRLLYGRWRAGWLLPVLAHPHCPPEVLESATDTVCKLMAKRSRTEGPTPALRSARSWSQMLWGEMVALVRQIVRAPTTPSACWDRVAEYVLPHLTSADREGALWVEVLTDPRCSAAQRARTIRERQSRMSRVEVMPYSFPGTRAPADQEHVTRDAWYQLLERCNLRTQVRLCHTFGADGSLIGDRALAALLADLRGQATLQAYALGRLLVRARVARQQTTSTPPRVVITTSTEDLLLSLLRADSPWLTEGWALWGALMAVGAPALQAPPIDEAVRRALAGLSSPARVARLRPFLSHPQREVRTYALQLLSEPDGAAEAGRKGAAGGLDR